MWWNGERENGNNVCEMKRERERERERESVFVFASERERENRESGGLDWRALFTVTS